MLVKRDIVIPGSGVLIEAEIHQHCIMSLLEKKKNRTAVILRRPQTEITYLPGVIYKHSRCRGITAFSESIWRQRHMLLKCHMCLQWNEFSLNYPISKVYSQTAQAHLLKCPEKAKFSVLLINDFILSFSEHIFLLKKAYTLYVNARSDDYGILIKTAL